MAGTGTRLRLCLGKVGTQYYCLFLLYIAFHSSVVTNTLTSVFVEATRENAEKNDAREWAHKFENWFQSIDSNGDGWITFAELEEHMRTPEGIDTAKALDLEINNVERFFEMLSDRAGNISPESFVVGCFKLKGVAKSMDMMDLIYTQKKLSLELADFKKDLLRLIDSGRMSQKERHAVG